mgnify:CR=1 FL=1|tara:strand:+ start:2093 stop:2650 length:558 start_codon:yes stop_codon:yes gene_type:complete
MTRILLFVFFILIGCSKENETQNRPVSSGSETLVSIDETSSTGEQENTYASTDFSNWKLTLPVDENNNGSPDEYLPASLVNGAYRSNNQIKPFMYDQIEDSSIVFYTYPQSSTTNSSYSRTELRELITMCQKDDEETCLIDQPDLNVVCIEIYQPVCGCDKVTYSNNCYANASGVSSWVDGECAD